MPYSSNKKRTQRVKLLAITRDNITLINITDKRSVTKSKTETLAIYDNR